MLPVHPRLVLPAHLATRPFTVAEGRAAGLSTDDLRWESVKVALEYDGRDHLADDRRSRDNARCDVAERHGWKVLVAVARDLSHGRTALVRRVEDGLRERGLRW